MSFTPPGFGGTSVPAGSLPPPPATPPPTNPLAVPPGMPWKHVSYGLEQAIRQIEGRRAGTIKSVKTPWSNFDDVGMNGIEWHTTMIIGARPAVGKTMLASLIANQSHRLNPDQEFAVLDFQFEMLAKNMAMRELSGHLGKSIKYLNSAEYLPGTKMLSMVDPKDVVEAHEYTKKQRHRRHFVIEETMTVPQMEKAVFDFYRHYKLPMICTLDHSMLVKRAANEKDAQEMLHSLGKMCTKTKRAIPIIWLVLSQLNREIDSAQRQEKPGSPGNYPNDSDLFGGDALLHHADIVCLMNRPAKYNLAVYGPDRFVVSPNLIAAHFTKVRSGNPRISIFEADFAKSTMAQVDTPKFAPSMRGPSI